MTLISILFYWFLMYENSVFKNTKKIIFNVDFIFAIGISEHDTEIS